MNSPATQHDTAGLQRALFRMQLDPGFATQLLANQAQAVASTRLEAPDLALLQAVDPVALSADRDGRRASQLLGNLAGEFPRCCALLGARSGPGRPEPAAFLAHPAFHEAIADDRPLPLAFAGWLEELVEQEPSLGPLVALESAMARGRRELRSQAAPQPGQLALSTTCRVLDLPAGTHAWAMLFEDGKIPPAPALNGQRESLLIQASAEVELSGRRSVSAERLEPAVAGLLQRLAQPAELEQLADYAAQLGASLDELRSFAAELTRDGILTLG